MENLKSLIGQSAMTWYRKHSHKLLFIFSFAIGCAHEVSAQTEIALLDLKVGEIAELQSFVSRDTVMLSYAERKQNLSLFRILPTNVLQQVPSEAVLPDAHFCGYEVNKGNEYLYFLKKSRRKNFNLYALHIDKKGNKPEILNDSIAIELPIIGCVNEDGMAIVTLDTQTNSLVIISVKGYSVTKKETIPLLGFPNAKSGDFDVVTNDTGWFYEATQSCQIYVKKDFIRVMVNKNHDPKTIVITFDRNKKSTNSKSFGPSSEGLIKAAIADSLLFRLSTAKNKFTLSVFSMETGGLLSEKEVLKESVPKDKMVYFDKGVEGKTMDEPLRRALSSKDRPIILARKISSNKYGITWGTYYRESGVGGMPGNNLIMALASTAILTSLKQETKGLKSRYLYSTFDGKNINLDSDGTSMVEKIDDFVVRRKPIDIRFQLIDSKHAIAFHEYTATNKLRVLKFGE